MNRFCCRGSLKPVVHKLRTYSHNAGYEYQLAHALCAWLKKEENSIELNTRTIVFPGCGAGAYELAFLDVYKTLERRSFERVMMCDREIVENDVRLWREYREGHIQVQHSLGELCDQLEEDESEFNVIFFHKAKSITVDPHYERFVYLCSRRCANPLIHAYNKGHVNHVFSARWRP